MGIIEVFVVLLVGIATGIGLVFIYSSDHVKLAARQSSMVALRLAETSRLAMQERRELKAAEKELSDLQSSITHLRNEVTVMESVYAASIVVLSSNKRVDAEQAIVLGRGPEWVYLYTFATYEQLAFEKRQLRYPMKLGRSQQSDVIDRVTQQVSGQTTAMSERAIVRLAFRVRQSAEMEKWMHAELDRRGHRVVGSVGREWFNTNPVEVEQLFRSYVLQYWISQNPVLAVSDGARQRS